MAKDNLNKQRESKLRQPVSPVLTAVIIVVIVVVVLLIYRYQSVPHGKRLSYRQMGVPASAAPSAQSQPSRVNRMAPPSGVAP